MKPFAGTNPAGREPKQKLHACVVVATGTLPADAEPDLAGPAWSGLPVEEALEEIASLLEGEEDQALVIRGRGDDGDIRVHPVEVEAHATLRDHRAWLKTGFPPPRIQRKVVLEIELEGEPELVREAASQLLFEFGEWVEVNLVTMSWR
jgi:hypothetical protein